MMGIIFWAKDWLRQKPAPPVANQNLTFDDACCNDDIIVLACFFALAQRGKNWLIRGRRWKKVQKLPWQQWHLCRQESPGALAMWAYPDTNLVCGQIGSIFQPILERWRNCRRQSGRTIWNDEKKVLKNIGCMKRGRNCSQLKCVFNTCSSKPQVQHNKTSIKQLTLESQNVG